MEYTTVQMIEELHKNKAESVKFEGKGYNGEDLTIEKKSHKGIDAIICSKNGRDDEDLKLTEYILGVKWTRVETEVDVLTAMREHYDNNKTIYCILGKNSKYLYKRGVISDLRDQNGNTITSNEIINGKWFVEEGDK